MITGIKHCNFDDCIIHFMSEAKAALPKKGHIFVRIGEGVTRDIEINDAHIHDPLEAKYRKLKQRLMINQLRLDPRKIPQSSSDHMI